MEPVEKTFSGETLHKVGDSAEDVLDVLPKATAFMSAHYGHP